MLAKKYNAQDIEEKWQKKWEDAGLYKWDAQESRENSFVIDTPPPGVSGMLHMGHVFSYTHTDFIARFMRMSGKNVFYPMGFDDNGLPTEKLTEKVKKVRAHQVSRREFKDMCFDVIQEAEDEFRNLFKTIALSVDFSQEYQTISNSSTKLSQMSFLDLYEKDHIYRNYAPTFWDPIDCTAIAQAEIHDVEVDGFMHYIEFLLDDGSKIEIATTRPELIAACACIFYHPDDQRFVDFDKRHAITPVYLKTIPIIKDVDVDMDKGSGLVMCCTFGDTQDVQWQKRHNLKTTDCVNKFGKMQDAGALDGLKVKDAREAIVQTLSNQGCLIRSEAITQIVKCAERSKARLEIISTKQWYVRILDKKEELLNQSAKCKWHPQYMKTRLDNWVVGLNQDWCISRQRYFGVPIPVWYSKRAGHEGEIIIPDASQLPVDPEVDLPRGYLKDEVYPELDVMDTWATSSVSPQINSRAITQNLCVDIQRHKKLFPADLRPQAHEIIRTWAFYTILKSYLHEDTLPWKNIMLSGWCLAKDKTKMSKSRGNVVTPKGTIQENGSDITRYWASTSKLGVDTAYNPKIFDIGKKLLNKLWNASRFAQIHIDNISGVPTSAISDVSDGKIFCDIDLWILSKLHETVIEVTEKFYDFEYCDARVAVQTFFLFDFCDNYLEIVKKRVYFEDGVCKKAQSAIYTIYHCLKTVLLLLAPFVPHITDEINECVFKDQKSLQARFTWPSKENFYYDAKTITRGDDLVAILELIRKYKSINGVALNASISEVRFSGCEDLTDSLQSDLINAAHANGISKLQDNDSMPKATLGSGNYNIYVADADQR